MTVEMWKSKHASINLLKVINVKFKLKQNFKHVISKQKKGGMKGKGLIK